ncbi:YncE family protein [Flavobacterium sp. FlaQc-50]|uniref:YncE family protein n=1 Tax=unclassified Flavobacterium TaxID=196869 RepID=UPI0037577399
MKFSKLLLITLSISLFVSCSSDDDKNNDTNVEIESPYKNGFFILNEGSLGQGSVSFLSKDLSTFTKDAYTSANPKDLIGKYVQNIFFDGDKAYIISGGSNVINVVNRYTFKLIAKIDSGLAKPRYGVVKDGKAYVTNANTYYNFEKPLENPNGNIDDYIAVINLTTNTVESKIELKATGNRIVLKEGKLYITEPYNNNNLLIVDIATKTLETIAIGSSADTMEEENGILYILRGPYGARSEIVKVKLSDKTTTKIAFPESLDGAGFLDIYESKIYYTAGSSVYAINTTATTPSTTPILTSTIGYLYGFAVNNNFIYLADSGDYKQDSKAYIYNLGGTLQKELTVGVAPNGFYFNN